MSSKALDFNMLSNLSNDRHHHPHPFRQGRIRPNPSSPPLANLITPSAVRLLEQTTPPPVPVRSSQTWRDPPIAPLRSEYPTSRTSATITRTRSVKAELGPTPDLPLRRALLPLQPPAFSNERHHPCRPRSSKAKLAPTSDLPLRRASLHLQTSRANATTALSCSVKAKLDPTSDLPY
ncbi:hypothetical protein M407DRAFT_28257 [Tulasnella calospora MUT 4182]|uniref:Uncharacterized protein n=1 Tax=Tulasnella calospora MUT 4182 TaxID=1051891 RepID=A0A0C3QCA9_9AGAM|nr:hypothetical protein M407DRAFT_28257 [Tulasnella calospora MUT 4182]